MKRDLNVGHFGPKEMASCIFRYCFNVLTVVTKAWAPPLDSVTSFYSLPFIKWKASPLKNVTSFMDVWKKESCTFSSLLTYWFLLQRFRVEFLLRNLGWRDLACIVFEFVHQGVNIHDSIMSDNGLGGVRQGKNIVHAHKFTFSFN